MIGFTTLYILPPLYISAAVLFCALQASKWAPAFSRRQMSLSRSLFRIKGDVPLGFTVVFVRFVGLLSFKVGAFVDVLVVEVEGEVEGEEVAVAAVIIGELRFDAAKCNGEFFSASEAFGSAPHSSKSFMTSLEGKLFNVWFLMIDEESRDEAK